jgi:hypothetical protein
MCEIQPNRTNQEMELEFIQVNLDGRLELTIIFIPPALTVTRDFFRG